MGYSPVPASSLTLCRYASFLARRMKFNSVTQYLNVIRLLHCAWNLPNPLQNNFQLAHAMRGIRRHLGDLVVRKKPVTPDMLKQILQYLDISLSFDAAIWAVCLTMFYGCLRRSNVMINSTTNFDQSKHLRRRDILCFPWGCLLHFRWSKVIQFKSRTFDVPLPRLENNVLCPASAVCNYLQRSMGASLDGPAFTFLSGNQVKVLSPEKFIKRIRNCLRSVEGGPNEMACHSFRRGSASFCNAIGVSSESIKLMGDWKSSCYSVYIDNNVKTRLEIVRRMQENV